MSDPSLSARLLPKPGQSRAFWRMPASPSALAWMLARLAHAHEAPLLAVTRDNQSAHQLEHDLRTLVGQTLVPHLECAPDVISAAAASAVRRLQQCIALLECALVVSLDALQAR